MYKRQVQRPGVFSLTKGMTVNDAIAKADGLKSDAFLDRAYITRTNKDFSTSKISFNLSEYLEGNNSSIDLFKEDVITIISKSDLNKDEFVSIVGEVKNPGVYPYSKNISLYDLFLIAGGYNSKAISDKVEITRRISENSLSENNISEIIKYATLIYSYLFRVAFLSMSLSHGFISFFTCYFII